MHQSYILVKEKNNLNAEQFKRKIDPIYLYNPGDLVSR